MVHAFCTQIRYLESIFITSLLDTLVHRPNSVEPCIYHLSMSSRTYTKC